MTFVLEAVARFVERRPKTSARAALLPAVALLAAACDEGPGIRVNSLGAFFVIVLIGLAIGALIGAVALGAFAVWIARRVSGKQPWDAKPLFVSALLVWLVWTFRAFEEPLLYLPATATLTLLLLSAAGYALRRQSAKLRNWALLGVGLVGGVAMGAIAVFSAPPANAALPTIHGAPVSVSAASFGGCVAYSSGEVVCDDLLELGVDKAPRGPIVIDDARGATEVAITAGIGCANIKSRDMVCWGGKRIAPKSWRDSFKKVPTWTVPRSEGAVDMAVTPFEILGRRDDGAMFGFPNPPPAGFEHARILTSSSDHVGSVATACILTDAGRVRCATWSDPWDKPTGLQLTVRELPELADVSTIAASFDDRICVSLTSGDLRCSKEGGPWQEPVLGIHDAVEVQALSGIDSEIAIRRKSGAVLVWTPNESSEKEGPKWAIVHPVFDSDGPLLRAGTLACSFRSDHMTPVARPPADPEYEAPRWISEVPTALPYPGGMLCTDCGGRAPDSAVEALLERR